MKYHVAGLVGIITIPASIGIMELYNSFQNDHMVPELGSSVLAGAFNTIVTYAYMTYLQWDTAKQGNA